MTVSAGVLDVGHGASAFVTDGTHTVVIDIAPTETLLRALEARGIDHVDAVLITHADHDHIGGLPALLADRHKSVEAVYLNPDPTKRLSSRRRRQLAAALEDALTDRRTKLHASLTNLQGRDLSVGDIDLEVLGPAWQEALAGAGGLTSEDERIGSNTMSAVVRVSAGGPRLLLCGDIDAVGLASLTERGYDLSAEYLVFPHHGGDSGSGNPAEFTARLCAAVSPSLVVFSISRVRYDLPRRDVVDAVRTAVADVWIACTQLSRNCAPDPSPPDGPHLADLPGDGRIRGFSCAGSLEIRLNEASVSPDQDGHQRYISDSVASPLCRLARRGGPP